MKVLKALEAVVGHLRKFLVDPSVLPLFEKSVSFIFFNYAETTNTSMYHLLLLLFYLVPMVNIMYLN